MNYPMIDEKLGQIAVDFWETTWQSEKRVLPLRNAAAAVTDQRCRCGPDEAGGAGAGKGIYPRCGERRVGRRVRAAGMESGYRFFSSEIGPSALFQAYKLIKTVRSRASPGGYLQCAAREIRGEEPGDAGPEQMIRSCFVL